MGIYLNCKKPYSLFASEKAKPYFVDKSMILKELIPFVQSGKNYICIIRPRRFGKTVMANMIGAFFSKGKDSKGLFQDMEISTVKESEKYTSQYNVIYITLNEVPDECCSFRQYMARIKKILTEDLMAAFPEYSLNPAAPIWDILNKIYEEGDFRFLFVLDEWDFIFHRDFVTEEDKREYIHFLSCLLKDQPYVLLAYMTGILPIAKYSSGSELNMFMEYTMASEELYSEYFGFTEQEVDALYGKYLTLQPNPQITREGLRTWYDGYHTKSGMRIYNPRSVVASLTNNNLGNYWTSSGPYDEIFYYIKNNVNEIRDCLALMVSGIPVSAHIQEYAATSMNLSTKNEILSAMVVYGFLSYENGCVVIPNKELMDKFADMLQKEPSLGYIHKLAYHSERMLRATKTGDTKTMLEILEYAHNTEIPLLSYNNETDLTAVVNLVYLSARDSYHIVREDKAGIGYADFIFLPVINKDDDCIILELKVNGTPRQAIEQIKTKKYMLRFMPKLGETPRYTGRILAVGIAYDKVCKKHSCEVEVLKDNRCL